MLKLAFPPSSPLWPDRALTYWVEDASPQKEDLRRVSPRAPTLAGVFGEIVTATARGARAPSDRQQIPIASPLTVAGLIGVAIGIVFQNLLPQQIAESMAREPEWCAAILEPTSLIGIHEIGASGTKIVMWIKTKRAVH